MAANVRAGDLARLRRLGLNTVIDLRSPAEIERFGVCRVESLPAAYCHVPVVLDPWNAPSVDATAASWLTEHYCRLLDESADGILAVLQLLADSANWPAVFHYTEAMRALLALVGDVHGSAEGWALDAGMPPSVIAALRAGLLV